MNIKVLGAVSRDDKYLSSLFARQEQLEMFPWIVPLHMAVRFPRSFPSTMGVLSREKGYGSWGRDKANKWALWGILMKVPCWL